jgi:nicotinamidase-related amidase
LLREFDEYADALALVQPNWQQVLTAARAQQMKIVYSCLGYQPPQPPSILQTATNWLWDLSGPAGQFPPDLQPQPAELIYAKPGWSALGNSEFCTYLAAQQVANVILLGTMLEFGLRQTALALADQGIGVLIVSDGVVPLTQAGGKQAAGELGHGMTKLRTTGELLALLDQLSTEETVLV